MRVHSGAPIDLRVHSGSRGFAGIVRVRGSGAPSGRPVHLGLRMISRTCLGSSGSFGFALAHSGAPRRCRVLSGSRKFTLAALRVVAFI